MDGAFVPASNPNLVHLATRINALSEKVERDARGMFEAAVHLGELLLQVKQQLPHGEFEAWVTTNTHVAPRTGRAYMRLASRLPELTDEERQRVAVLPLREAVNAIKTSPVAPERSPACEWHCATQNRREKLRTRVQDDVAYFRKTFVLGIELGYLKPEIISSARARLNGMLKLLDELETEAAEQANVDREGGQ